ncbi:MAG: hypothetical protein PHI79_02790 [Sulfurovaceae bacterium]|nr:hypothetical protein [Sulfurovaceae bacterium]MDD5548506.1 hypothetical protein [Sulfurovaceae bacterium]
MRNIYIQSTSLFLSDNNTPQSDMKEELKSTSGQSFRRINRYILLGLAGLFRLANISKTNKLTSLYVGTKKGCVQDTTEILHQMYKEKLLPMPFAFIAASANMANYHIANTLGLQSGSYTISHEYSPFEMAFKMSLSDLLEFKGDSSIVGCIDEEISTDDGVKNGSYWIKLTTDSQATIGKIISYQEFSTFDELFKTDLSDMSVIVNDSTKESIESFVNGYTNYKNIFDIFETLEKQEYKTIALIFRLSRSKISLCVIDSSR